MRRWTGDVFAVMVYCVYIGACEPVEMPTANKSNGTNDKLCACFKHF